MNIDTLLVAMILWRHENYENYTKTFAPSLYTLRSLAADYCSIPLYHSGPDVPWRTSLLLFPNTFKVEFTVIWYYWYLYISKWSVIILVFWWLLTEVCDLWHCMMPSERGCYLDNHNQYSDNCIFLKKLQQGISAPTFSIFHNMPNIITREIWFSVRYLRVTA